MLLSDLYSKKGFSRSPGFFRIFIFILIVVGAFSVAAVLFLGRLSKNQIENAEQLESDFLKIQYYDELLTMSARMAAASGDLSYKTRYDANVQPLDDLIQETKKLLKLPYSLEEIKETDAANQKLVEMETKAFDLVGEGKRKEAYELLHSPEYLTQKAIYWDSLNSAMKEEASQVESRNEVTNKMIFGIKILGVLLIISSFAVVHLFYRQEKKTESALTEQEVLRVTLTTVSDFVGNALNRLLLLKLKIDESREFTDEERQIFDDVVYGTSKKLKDLREMRSFKTRETSVGKILDPEAQDSNPSI